MKTPRVRLQQLYEEVSALTLSKCSGASKPSCNLPFQCCSPEYCEYALKENPGLARTNHPRLPLMGPNGCTAKPHQRPICAIHVCERALYDLTFAEKYYELRDTITELEYALEQTDG